MRIFALPQALLGRMHRHRSLSTLRDWANTQPDDRSLLRQSAARQPGQR